jgi:hypothetical protein
VSRVLLLFVALGAMGRRRTRPRARP